MEQDPIMTFDSLYTYPHIQMLKMALPYIPAEYQHLFAIYIKFSELQFTIAFTKQPFFSHSFSKTDDDSGSGQSFTSFLSFCDSIQPYLKEEEKEKIQKIRNLFSTMNRFQEMKPLLDMMMAMQETDGEMHTDEILKQFLTEEQMMMFQSFL